MCKAVEVREQAGLCWGGQGSPDLKPALLPPLGASAGLTPLAVVGDLHVVIGNIFLCQANGGPCARVFALCVCMCVCVCVCGVTSVSQSHLTFQNAHGSSTSIHPNCPALHLPQVFVTVRCPTVPPP